MNDFNPQQKQAIEHEVGPLLILAGAGSGKTRVLTHRIARLLEKGLAFPEEILALTFTNKAAGEMKERIFKLLPERFSPSQMKFAGTFHSICVKFLRFEGKEIGIGPNFTIYDEADKDQSIRDAMKVLHISPKEINPNTIGNFISSAKNELISPLEYANSASGMLAQALEMIYPKYEAILKENNALDFDDLIGKTVELFQSRDEVRSVYQRKFKFILVDEYQDTNHAQYVLVNLLAKQNRNICVVGDDDQSIYSWRGANIKNILSFEQDYPEAVVVKLEQNYRSTKTILEAAYEVIKHNNARKEKKLWTGKETGVPISVYNALDEKDESFFVAEKIRDLEKEVELDQIAVLYRTNAQSRTMEEAMLKFGVPYKIYGGISFYSRKEIKDVLSYLRAAQNQKDNLSLSRIINSPPRKIGPKTIEILESESSSFSESITEFLLKFDTQASDELKRKSSVADFAKLVTKLVENSNKLKVTDYIKYVISESGYLKWLDDGTEENQSRIENIKELLTLASKFDNSDIKEGLSEFLNEVSLIEEQQLKSERNKDQKKVSLMSLHSAKGLEFDTVFIVGAEENLFPHSRSYADREQMEEERRLAYVGITRAKRKLYLTHAASRRFYGTSQANPVSRFVEDIPEHLITMQSWDTADMISSPRKDPWEETDESSESFTAQEGDMVTHPIFGKGRIVNLNTSTVKVNFLNFGIKQLATEYANLQKV